MNQREDRVSDFDNGYGKENLCRRIHHSSSDDKLFGLCAPFDELVVGSGIGFEV